MNAPTDGRLTTRIAASVALLAFSMVVAVGFLRVFEDWSFASDMVVLIVAGHGLSIVLRRVYLVIALPVQVVALAWLASALRYPTTLTGGVPGGRTWSALMDDLSVVREEFPEATAPVTHSAGWAALAVIGITLVVLLADVFAFRARTRFEALVPGGVLFVIVGALGSGRLQVITAMLLIVAGVVAVATLRVHQLRPPRILVGRRTGPVGRVAFGALPVGILAATIAAAVGPLLPGSDSDALYEPIGGDGSTIRSPLVDIRSRLVDQSDTELFTVRADEGAYWRLTTLSDFDGQRWRLPERTVSDTDDRLSAPIPGSRPIRQTVQIEALSGRLVPAAAEPVAASGRGLRWNQESATLLTSEDGYTRGERFEIESAAPSFEPRQLAAASPTVGLSGDEHLSLPGGLPDSAVDAAERVTAGAANDYERALRLQNWFRSEFSYSLEVQEGHGNDAIAEFLERRIGYCEQFAGTFAAMARHLGMPSRVAVGYTPGVTDQQGVFSVAGRNAHAWPEIWFGELGWVPFEPTPGRGIPGSQGYTGVPPQQAGPSDDLASTTTTTEAATSPVDSLPGTGNEPDIPPAQGDNAPPIDPDAAAGLGPEPSTGSTEGGGGGPNALLITLIVCGVLVALLATPALVRRWRRARWRATPRTAVAQLWARLERLMAAGGLQIDPSRTPSEFARLAARTSPGVATEIRALASVLDRAAYGLDDIDADVVDDCEQWYASVERSMSALIPLSHRIWRYLTSTE